MKYVKRSFTFARVIYNVSQKTSPNVFSYNSRKHCRIFIIVGRNITEKVRNQKMLYFSISPNYCFCTTLWNWKHGNCVFSRT